MRWSRPARSTGRDVYKRQSFDSSFLDIFPNFIGQVNELLQPEFRFTPRSDSSLTTEPVSYTHLDVYKRQASDGQDKVTFIL